LALFFYNIFLHLYTLAVRIASIRSTKAVFWLNGRKDIFQKIALWKSTLNEADKIIWMHCASLGEFEQGRPVVENSISFL
jgi:3-deoxy-D-manno-octulosonic-acid transferase